MSRAIRSCLLGVGLLCLSFGVGQADAQTKSPPPAGMTQQQYDELVKSVGQSVIQTLDRKGAGGQALGVSVGSTTVEVDEETLVAERIRRSLRRDSEGPWRVSRNRDGPVAAAGSLGPERGGGRGPWAFLGLLAMAARRGASCRSRRRAPHPAPNALPSPGNLPRPGGYGAWRALALLDGLAVVALWIVVHLALGALFAKAGVQTQFAAIVLRGLVTWRMFVLFFRLFLRPDTGRGADRAGYRRERPSPLRLLRACRSGLYPRAGLGRHL